MGAYSRLANQVAGLTGWYRCLAALAMGVVATAGLPPWGLVPLLLPAFTGFVWLIDGSAQARRPAAAAALIGWWFGIGYFTSGLYWIFEAMLVDAASHAWLIPIALVALGVGLGLFPALVAWITFVSVTRRWVAGPGRVLFFAGAWTVLEWLRGWILTGLPWHLVGYAWSDIESMLQPAALFGVWGLTLLTVVAASMPAVLADGSHAYRAVMGAALAVAVAWVGGALRLAATPEVGSAPGIRLRLVQASIPQYLKWSPELRAQHLETHISLSKRLAAVDESTLSIIIWPETAVPYLLNDDADARLAVSQVVPPNGLLISGTVRTDRQGAFRNSLVAIDEFANVTGLYDKAHLVPFGEYVPLRGIVPLEKLTPGIGDFKPGRGRATLHLPGVLPFSPLICYEVIFPARVVARDDRPLWLLNLTNDAWFGTGAGPRQHLEIARLRAIEEGLPLVRAANTGISAVIDPHGRIVARLELGVSGILDADLPSALEGITPYGKFGDWWLVVLLLGLVPLARLASPRVVSHPT